MGDRWSDRDRNGLCDLVVYSEDIGEVAVVTLGPHVVADLCFHQLRRRADAVAGFAQAALKNIADAEVAADLFDVNGATLVGKRGIAGDDEQRGIARQRRDDICGDPICKKFLLWVGTA